MLTGEETSRQAACHLCGSDDADPMAEGPDYEYACKPGNFRLVRCARCQHVFADPMPTLAEIPALYPPTYYTVNPDSPLYLRGFVHRTKIRRDVRRLLRLFGRFQPGSILDVGCGDGARLLELRQALGREIDLVGLDLTFESRLVEDAQAQNVRLVEGNVESDLDPLPDETFDFVVMSQLIEHLREPRVALEALRDKLAPDGHVLLETPNLGGLDYRLFRKRYWGGYHIPRHLHLFTSKSLENLMHECGYRVVSQGQLPSPGFWIISLRNSAGLRSTHRGKSVLEFINFSNLAVVSFFTALDLCRAKLGFATSNQFLLAARR